MSQLISNSKERRNTMLRFSGLFLLTVIVACLVFLRLFYVKTEVPKQELSQFKDLAPVLEQLVDYGKSLEDYEQAILSNPVEAPKLESVANDKSVHIHSMLLGKEGNPHFSSMNKILNTGDRFLSFLKEVDEKFLPVQKELEECKRDREDLEEEHKEMKRDLEKCEDKVERCKKW